MENKLEIVMFLMICLVAVMSAIVLIKPCNCSGTVDCKCPAQKECQVCETCTTAAPQILEVPKYIEVCKGTEVIPAETTCPNVERECYINAMNATVKSIRVTCSDGTEQNYLCKEKKFISLE